MKKYLLAALLLLTLSLPTSAALQATAGADSIVLRTSVCNNPAVLAHIPAEWHKDFLNAEGVISGAKVKPCWLPTASPRGSQYEDGSKMVLPASIFKEKGV